MRSVKNLLVLMLTVGLILSPCLAMAKTLKIGSLSPLTGQYAADGNDIRQGVEIAIAMWEAKGGVPGSIKSNIFPRIPVATGNRPFRPPTNWPTSKWPVWSEPIVHPPPFRHPTFSTTPKS